MRPLVQRMGHVTLGAVDVEAAASDASSMLGLRVADSSSAQVLLSSNQRAAEMILKPAAQSEIQICGLEAISTDAIDAVRKRCMDAGLKVLSDQPSLPCIEKSVTFSTSEGHVFEVHTPMPTSDAPRYLGAGIHPRSLDHVNFTSEDPKQFTADMSAACGLLLSQRTTGYEICWLRAGNYRHHTVAIVKNPTGVHHISWDYASFQDFKTVADTLGVEDRKIVWGPGRHGPGDNLFMYYRDAAGFMTECITEMELILDDDQPTNVVDPGENLSNYKVVNQWGALPPQDWIDHYTPYAEFKP